MSTYPFDQAWEKERSRLGGLEQRLDRGTIHHLETLGVGPAFFTEGVTIFEKTGYVGSIKYAAHHLSLGAAPDAPPFFH